MNEPTKRLCSVDGCTQPHLARDYCQRHWRRWRRHGDPLTLLIGQSPESPAPCIVCGGPIETESQRIAPRVCSGACQSRRRRQRMNGLRERVLAGLSL